MATLPRVIAESVLDRQGLRDVADLRRGGMRGDIVQLVRLHLGPVEGIRHRHARAASGRLRRGEMEGIGRQRTAERLGVDRGAAADRMLLGLEDQHARALPRRRTHHAPDRTAVTRPPDRRFAVRGRAYWPG